MSSETPVITGIGHFFPETVLDNSFFEDLRIDTTAAWIEERVGVIERRSILSREDIIRLRNGETTFFQLRDEGKILKIAEMSKLAFSRAAERRLLAAQDVVPDTIISGTSTPDFDTPAHACSIANALGIECSAFDLNSACSSFILALHVTRAMMAAGMTKTTAVFTSDRLTARNNYADRSNCIIFGDSCTAALIEASEEVPGLEVLDTSVSSAPSGFDKIRLGMGGTFTQQGAVVQKFAVSKTVAIAEEMMEKNGLVAKDISYFISHQANLRMLTSVVKRLGFSEEQHLFNVDKYGNQGCAGAPSVLSLNWEKFKPGDLILMTVVGGGLSWGSALLRKK